MAVVVGLLTFTQGGMRAGGGGGDAQVWLEGEMPFNWVGAKTGIHTAAPAMAAVADEHLRQQWQASIFVVDLPARLPRLQLSFALHVN